MTSCESGWIREFTYSGLPCILEDYFGPVSSAIGPLLASRRNHWKHLLNFVAVSETRAVTEEMRDYIATAFCVPCPQSLCSHATLLNLCSLHLPPWPHPGPLGDPVQHPWFSILIASVLENAKPCNDQKMKKKKKTKHSQISSFLSLLFPQSINIIWKHYSQLWAFRIIAGWVILKANSSPLMSICFSVCCLVHQESGWDPPSSWASRVSFLILNAEKNWLISGTKLPLSTYHSLSVPKWLLRLHPIPTVRINLVHISSLSHVAGESSKKKGKELSLPGIRLFFLNIFLLNCSCTN